jgi:hypothetical protein
MSARLIEDYAVPAIIDMRLAKDARQSGCSVEND